MWLIKRLILKEKILCRSLKQIMNQNYWISNNSNMINYIKWLILKERIILHHEFEASPVLPFFQPLSLSKFPPILVCTIALHLLINLALKRESQQLSWIPLAHASSPLRNRVDLHPRTSNFEAASQDDACTNVIALEAYSEEVTLNGYSSHQCIGNTGIRIRVFSGWMGSIGRYCREKEGKFREAIYLDRKERSFKCFSLLFS